MMVDDRPSVRFRTAVAMIALGFAASACAPADEREHEPVRIPPEPPIGVEEVAGRRAAAMRALPDGIVLVHAKPSEKAMEQWGFVQDADFQYLGGLAEVPGAIVALDGPARSSHLFLPPAPMSFGMPVEGLVPSIDDETAGRLRFDSVRPWSDFVPWVEGRLSAGVRTLYVDEARAAEASGVPVGVRRVAGERALWREAVAAAFPSARIASARSVLVELRAVKSAAEVRILERNARMTAASLLAVAKALEPGVRQRDTESTMISACIAAGGEGPSFWPWTMSGPNAHLGELVGAFFRYDQGDRQAAPGELVRVDIGCAGGGYGADVGRTLPASGRFDDGQAEAWDLLIAGYRAGLAAMVDGTSVSDVRAASIGAVRALQDGMTTPTGRAAAAAILDGGEAVWHIHGVGIESGEDIPAVLRAGMVVAYEPGFVAGDDAYYLEDMIVVTADGHRVLSEGLPYTAAEIAEAMRD